MWRVRVTLLLLATALLVGCRRSGPATSPVGARLTATGEQTAFATPVAPAAPDLDTARRVAKANPNSGRAHLELGEACLAQQRVPEGLAELQKAIQLDPHSETAYRVMAQLYQSVNYLDRETDMLLRLVGLHTRDQIVYLRLGEIYLRLGWLDRAEDVLQQAVRIAPGQPQPQMELAQCRFARGKTVEAIQILQEMHRQHPELSEATSLLGQYLLAADRGAEAEALLRQALQNHPGDRVLEPLLVNCLLRRGDNARLPEVIALLKEIILRGPAKAEYYCWLGRAYERSNRPADATVAYQHAVKLDPAFENTTLALGRLYLRQERQAEGRQLIRYYTAIRQNSNDYNIARERIRLDPRDGEAHYRVAMWDLRVRAYPVAIMEFERTLQLRPRDAAALKGLHQALLASGRSTEARSLEISSARLP
jgi:tetratricopeptide (TPR) repeat protein